ncbi:hypothetical protein [Gluconobacter wancherniae]|uniref:hypothetical protein n=1 Tax=Gluconobacter wancherniae TaxID=1307955 RepID=UPI001B8D6D05|nr:hypothetical protein [Gluconobacter wancherniae]MBS1089936.1 hypothetical protein [Gluconobacter wancherniae]
MRKCIKADGVPLTPSEKSKRYREKQKAQILYMKKIIKNIEDSKKPKSQLIHDLDQTDIEDFTNAKN